MTGRATAHRCGRIPSCLSRADASFRRRSGLHSSVWEHSAAAEKWPCGIRHARLSNSISRPQLECGHLCPITMTSASLAALMGTIRGCFVNGRRASPAGKYDPSPEAAGGEDRADAWHGDDGEAGRYGRARQSRHAPTGQGSNLLSPHWPQMVHVGADVGCLPDVGTDKPEGRVLLPGAASPWRRQPQTACIFSG
jgi:hypothetical protein